MKLRQGGLTLVELLVVLAIVGILAAVALPTYQSQQRKGSRAAAQALLVNISNRQAQYLLDARNYAVGAGALAALNVAVPREVTQFYIIAVENGAGGATPATPPSFLIRATPIAGTHQEGDGELRLAHDGAKSRGGNPGW